MTFPLMVLIKTFDWSSFCSQMPNTVLNRLSVSADVLTVWSSLWFKVPPPPPPL